MSDRRNKIEIMQAIIRHLEKNNDVALGVTEIAMATKLNYNSAKKYIRLIEKIQGLPKIEMVSIGSRIGFKLQEIEK
jgi:predicted transcriptional regulator